MIRIFCFLLMLLMLGCGDEGVILDTPSTDYGAPSAPSANVVVIPLTALTSVETEYQDNYWVFTIYATHNDINYVSTMQRWHGRLTNGFTELGDDVVPVGSTRGYRVTWELGSDRIKTVVYDRGNRYKNTHRIDLSAFSLSGQVDAPVNPSSPLLVNPSSAPPVNPSPPPPVNLLSVPPVNPSPPPPQGGYVVALHEINGHCQSSVIHSDYVSIDYQNKTITYTGQDGEVDPGDTVREYIKIETGYTYEQASERAPEILDECRE